MKDDNSQFCLKEIKIEVTHNCHLACVHCSSLAGEGNTLQMSLDACKRILYEASSLGVEEVAFSGGDPLLWPHLFEAVDLSKKLHLSTLIYTTGFVDDYINAMKHLHVSGCDRVIFSLYSYNAADHDSITGVTGSFTKTIAAMKAATQENICVELHFVPMRSNFDHLKRVVKIAKNLSLNKVSILRLVPQGRAENGTLLLTHSENISLREDIVSLQSDGFNIRVGSPYNFLMLNRSSPCSAGIDRLTISPDLSICPCDGFKQIKPEMLLIENKYNSLADCSLKDVWTKSSYLKAIREYLRNPLDSQCAHCVKLDKCLSGCLAQKVHNHKQLITSKDPMCLRKFTDFR